MKLIIFDCDGVLINSEDIHTEAELDFLSDAGVSYEREYYIQTFMGMTPSEWEKLLAADVEKRTGHRLADDFFHKLHAHVSAGFEQSLEPLPSARDTISGLHLKRCVASSSPTEQLHWKLQRTGLHDLFDPHIYSSQMVARGKPAPDLFLHAAASLEIAPKDCLVLEDSANGVKAAKAAGMTAVGFTLGNHCSARHGDLLQESGADEVAASYDEFSEIVRRFL